MARRTTVVLSSEDEQALRRASRAEGLSQSELIRKGIRTVTAPYRRQRPAMRRLLQDLARGAYRYEPPTVEDLARARELDEKFKKLDLGLVDASVTALAERLGITRVLTIDSDFAAVRFGPGHRLAFDLACPLPG